MARFTTTIPSRSSQADAFAYMAAFENAAEWDPSVTEATRAGAEPLGVGTSFEVVSRFGPRLVPLTYTIVRYEPDRLVVLEARSKGFVSTDTITVEPAGLTSTVTYDAVLEFSGLGRLADPLMQLVFNRVGRKAEARLREVPVIARAVDGLLEASVVGSFTRVGYLARRRLYHWPELASYDLTGRTAIVTGATSGLGYETARTLASLGASVCIVGRDAERTETARVRLERETGATVEAGLADLSLLADARAFAEGYAERHERLDVLVHNAGALLAERTLTNEDNETTIATHVLSPFLMTSLLLPRLEAASTTGRVVLVASGGMYSERLDVAGLAMPEGYDGVKMYARAKRAQVTLAREWARRLLDRPVSVNAMHPGWCDTPGIRDALPGFSRVIGPLLRTAPEGIDTTAWLAAAPEAAALGGRFFLDRRPRATHKVPWTRRPDEELEAERLWRWCAATTGAPAI